MNNLISDEIPAFPSASGISPHNNGMHLRDFFAGMALTYFAQWGHGHEQKAAKDSYAMADAMLEERKKQNDR